MNYTIIHENNADRGFLLAKQDGETIARLSYLFASKDTIIIDYSKVLPRFEDQGVRKALINSLADYAMKQHLKVVPLCPFAKLILQSEENYSSILE